MLLAWINLAIQGVLLIAALAATVLLRKRVPSNNLDDTFGGFDLGQNVALKDDPMPDVKGRPIWFPPLLSHWTSSVFMNSMYASDVSSLYMLLHLGYAGEAGMDGSGLNIWMDNVRLLQSVDSSEPDSKRTLSPIDSTNKAFVFPAINVDSSSVVIYVDGVEVGRSNAGGDILVESSNNTFTAVEVTPRLFVGPSFSDPTGLLPVSILSTRSTDSDVPLGDSVTLWDRRFVEETYATLNAARVGSYLPIQGVTSPGNLGVMVVLRGSNVGTAHQSLTNVNFFVPTTDIKLGRDDQGLDYFYLAGYFGDVYSAVQNGTPPRIFISGTVSPRLILSTDVYGRLVVTFPYSVSGKVTATWSVTAFPTISQNYSVQWGTGAPDDKITFPSDDTRSDYRIDQELVKGVPVSVDTSDEVDNFEIQFESGPNGFYGIAGNSGTEPISRALYVWLKTYDATDIHLGGNTDPTQGWVQLRAPYQQTTDPYLWILVGKTGHTARWRFHAGDSLWQTQTNLFPVHRHPFKLKARYSLKVVAINSANANTADFPEPDKRFSDLFLAAFTEVREGRVEFPRQAMMLLSFADSAVTRNEPSIRIRFRGKKVIVPDSDYKLVTREDGYVEIWEKHHFATKRPYKPTWTRSPIWNTVDLIVDEENGGGQFYDWSNIDLPSALTAEDYCKETVSGEVRSYLDIATKQRASLFQSVNDYLAGSGVIPVLGDKWYFVIDKPLDQGEDPAFVITDAHVVGGAKGTNKPRLVVPRLEDLPTELEISYPDETLDGDTEVVVIELTDAEREGRGIVTEGYDLPGVVRRSQVIRWGTIALRQMQSQQIALDLVAAGWDLINLRAGEIVQYSSDDMALTSRLYRVVLSGFGSNLIPVIGLQEHDPTAFTGGLHVSGAVPPGARNIQNVDETASTVQMSISRVSNQASGGRNF